MKLWGGRFGEESSPSAEAFGASIGFDRRLWPYDLMGSAAHCRMLAQQGIISAEDARAILAGLSAVAAELESGTLEIGPAWEDIHTRVEARLAELIGEPAGRLHTARSRNDQVALDMRMFSREALLGHIDALVAVQRALLALADASPDAIMPGYTHLQRAQPVLFGHHLLAYVEMFARDASRLLDAYRRTDVMPLGSGALAGVPYPIDRRLVADLLGFAELSANSIDAVADRDFLVEHLAALALITSHLSRLAEEVVLWSTEEFGFIELPDAFATGSSIMPQKRNPDVAELVRGKTGRVYGALMALLTVLKGLPLAYDKDLQEDKEAYFDAVDTVQACLSIMTEMLADARPRAERMADVAGASFSLATDYADHLAKRGLPFREAHAAVGRLVRLCEERGCDLSDLTLDDLRSVSPLFEADAVGLDAKAAVAARDVPGGTAPGRVAEAGAAAVARLEAVEAEAAGRRATLPTLDRLLRVPSSAPQVSSGSNEGSPRLGGTEPAARDGERGTRNSDLASDKLIECRVISGQTEFARCAAIRTEVFVVEQRVPPEEEMDELDHDAIHVLAWLDGAPVATGRLIVGEDAHAKIGRMAVLRPHRRQGVGSAVLMKLMEEARRRGVRQVSLAGQLHAIPFYERFGFVARGDVFVEAGIQHRMMDRDIG
jgi:argininosuccinate lyase